MHLPPGCLGPGSSGLLIVGMFLGGCSTPIAGNSRYEEILSIRQRALEQLRAFQSIQKPDLSSIHDEHIGRATVRNFIRSQETALLALAWIGEPKALEQVEEKLSGFFKDPAQKEQRYAMRYEGFNFFTADPDERATDPGLTLLLGALDRHRPELAERLRAGLLGSRRLPREKRGPFVWTDNRERDRMALWMKSRPEDAELPLTALLRNEEIDVNKRCDAAYALASMGNVRGLEWLRAGSLGNLGLGARPAIHLLESGPEGEALYWQELRKGDAGRISYALKTSIAECREDLFLKYLTDFLGLKNQEARIQAQLRMHRISFSGELLDRVLEFLDKNPEADDETRHSLVESLCFSPPHDASTRAAASLWMDHLERGGTAGQWPSVARAFLAGRLGSNQVMSRWARRCLADPAGSIVSYDVLAEAGSPDDVPMIWNSLQERSDPAYGAPVHAWLAILRLTSNMTE